jgi:hypothetical protein
MENDRLKLNGKGLNSDHSFFHIHYMKVVFILIRYSLKGGRLPDVLSVSFRKKGVHKCTQKNTYKTVKIFGHLSSPCLAVVLVFLPPLSSLLLLVTLLLFTSLLLHPDVLTVDDVPTASGLIDV